MTERNNDSLPRRSSPSQSRDRDDNESSGIKRPDVSNRSSRSPLQDYGVEIQRTDREQDVDGIRRDGFPNEGRIEEEKERNDERHMKYSHFQEDAFHGEYYPDDPTLVRSTFADPKPSGYITLRDDKYNPSYEGNVQRIDETDQLESNSRGCSDSSRHRLKPPEQIEANVVAMKGERYSEDIRERDNTCLQESSPLSQVGSSGANFQEESSRTLSLTPRCCIGVNDSDRVDEGRPDYGGNRCASMALQTGHLDDYVGRTSPRDQQGKYLRDISCGDHDSTALSRRGKEVVEESLKCYQTVTEFPSVKHGVNNLARETDLPMQARGSLSNSYVRGSYLVDVDEADTHLEFCPKERMNDQFGFVKEHHPFVELGSSVVNKREGETYHYMNSSEKEQNTVYFDDKFQRRREDYQYDGVDRREYLDSSGTDVVVHRDNKTPQSIILCINKEREAYLDNERNAVNFDERRQELRNEYHFGNDGRMRSDVHGEEIVVGRDGRIVDLQEVCLNREREAYLDKERKGDYSGDKRRRNEYHFGNDGRMHSDVHGEEVVVDRDGRIVEHQEVCLNSEREAYLNHERKADYSDDKRRRNEYHYGNDGRMHSDVYGEGIVVDRDGRIVELQEVCLNKEREAYLDNERKAEYSYDKRLRNEYHFGNDGRIHSDVHGADIVVDRDGRVVPLPRVGLNKRKAADFDNERKDVYLHHRSQQLSRGFDAGTDARIYHDANRLDNVVDREDARGLRYRGLSLNNRKEAYSPCESPQRLKYHESNSYGMMHPDVNKSDIVVDREDYRSLKYRGVSLNDRKEAYLQCESQQLLNDHETTCYGTMHPNVNISDILVDRESARALERRGSSFNDRNESYLGIQRNDAYLHYERQRVKKDYDYGIDDSNYRDVNSSDIVVDHGDLEHRNASFNDGNREYLGNESKMVYQHHRIQQHDYDSGIDARMYPSERMHLDVSRSSAHKQDEEALRRGRYASDDRRQIYMDDDHLPHNSGHVKAHGNMRYPDGRHHVYHHSNDEILLSRDEYRLRDDVGEVTHEYFADDYKRYGDVKQSRISHEKPSSGRFRDNEVGYDYRGKAVEGGTSSKQSRYLDDERNFGDESHASIQRPRVSVKERLGGRVVEDSRVHVKYRIQNPIRNPKRKGKCHNRNQKTNS